MADMIDNCTAVILAGGESKRMGKDKALLRLGQHSLLEHSFQSISPLFTTTYVSVRTQQKHLSYPQIVDQHKARSPMIGIAAALAQCSTAWLFVLACDMPFISQRLIQTLAEKRGEHQVIVPKVSGFLQPLAAFYAKSCLPLMQAHIQENQRSLQRLIVTLDHHIMSEETCLQADPSKHSFFDLDTLKNVEKAKGILYGRSSPS